MVFKLGLTRTYNEHNIGCPNIKLFFFSCATYISHSLSTFHNAFHTHTHCHTNTNASMRSFYAKKNSDEHSFKGVK